MIPLAGVLLDRVSDQSDQQLDTVSPFGLRGSRFNPLFSNHVSLQLVFWYATSCLSHAAHRKLYDQHRTRSVP